MWTQGGRFVVGLPNLDVEAQGLALRLWPVTALGQIEKPGGFGGQARGGRRLGAMRMAVVLTQQRRSKRKISPKTKMRLPRRNKRAKRDQASVRAARKKKARFPMTGSLAIGFHEGSRSEYLAQFVFSSFGTAIPVPHQEDTGIDLYCTLLEQKGKRAWPRAYYSVQVKSTMDPWVFDSPESVQWVIEHPLPIFLCIVQKSEARILVYHTTPRFAAWILPIHKKQLRLIPGTETKGQTVAGGWTEGESFNLTAPILNFTVAEALNPEFRKQVAKVLKYWIEYDVENLFRIKSGIHHFQVPYQYETNSTSGSGGSIDMGGPFSEESLVIAQDRLKELLGCVTTHYHSKGELERAMIYAMALRELCPIYEPYKFNPHDVHLHGELNDRFGLTSYNYAFDACDALLKEVKKKLPRQPLSEQEHKSAAIALFAKGWALTRSDAETRWPTLHPDIQKHFLDSAKANIAA
jgi:hypothetical protein